MKSVSLTLIEPIMAHGETVQVLAFRPPTGKDVRKNGFPLDVKDGPRTFDHEAMCGMISDLASIPPSSVDALSMTDWLGCATVVAGFLGAPGRIFSTDTSTAPSSGVATSNT